MVDKHSCVGGIFMDRRMLRSIEGSETGRSIQILSVQREDLSQQETTQRNEHSSHLGDYSSDWMPMSKESPGALTSWLIGRIKPSVINRISRTRTLKVSHQPLPCPFRYRLSFTFRKNKQLSKSVGKLLGPFYSQRS